MSDHIIDADFHGAFRQDRGFLGGADGNVVLQAIKVRREGACTTFDQQVKACFGSFELVAAIFQSYHLGEDLLLLLRHTQRDRRLRREDRQKVLVIGREG